MDYPFDVSTTTADITAAKLSFNSVISTPSAMFLTADRKDFSLSTPMSRYKYMNIPIWMLPDNIIKQFNLTPLFRNGFVYVEIRHGMYGLPQAGCLANNQHVAFLAPHGYKPCALTPGLWHHTTQNIIFSLLVDDFGIRYSTRADADHLVATLKSAYEVSLDWTGSQYCGLSLNWDYLARTCDMSMPGYIERPCTGSNTLQHSSPNMRPHTRGYVQTTAPKHNLPSRPTTRHPSTSQTRQASSKSLAPCSSTHAPSSQLHASHRYRRTRHGTIAGNTNHNGKTLPVAELLCCTSRCHHPIFCQQHATCRRERCLIAISLSPKFVLVLPVTSL